MLEYLDKEKFACHCCGQNFISDKLIEMVNTAQKIAGIQFVITSGCRCKNLNALTLGSSPDSSHIKGLAVDIKVRDSGERWIIVFALYKAGFKRIEDAATWVHGDIDLDKPQNVLFRK
jgi:hypothetical protein